MALRKRLCWDHAAERWTSNLGVANGDPFLQYLVVWPDADDVDSSDCICRMLSTYSMFSTVSLRFPSVHLHNGRRFLLSGVSISYAVSLSVFP